MLVVPKNTDLGVEVHFNGQRIFDRKVFAGIPIEFTQFDHDNQGQLSLSFTAESSLERQQNFEEKKNLDELCENPYIRLEFFIENVDYFNENVKKIKKELKNLNEFDFDFSNILRDLPVDTEISGLKLLLDEGNKFKYDQFKLHVIKEFDLELHDEIEDSNKNVNSLKSFEKHRKYDFKLEVSSDFIFSGSMFFVIIREEQDISSLKDLECVHDGKCILSEKPRKNSNFLHVVLPSGKYRLLLIDIQQEESYKSLLKTIHFIPVSARLSISVNEEENERFNCQGKKLPVSLNTDDQLNNNEQYFEINSEIIINLNTFVDSTIFTPKHDSLFRVTAFHNDGLSIDLKLQENGQIVAISHNKGDSNGLIYSLKANHKYILELIYNNSIIDETKFKSCEKIFLRLIIFSVEYHNKLYNDHHTMACDNNLNLLDKYLNPLVVKDEHSSIHVEEANNSIFTFPSDLAGTEDLIYKKEFYVEHESVLVNIDILSDYTSNLIIPVIDKHEDSNGKIVHRFEKMSFQEGSLRIKLNKGKYIFFLSRGLNQFYETKDETFKNNVSETIKFFPKCGVFQLRISTIVLDNSKMKNWDCNNHFFHTIPRNFNNLQELGYQKQKDHFVYFQKALLVPKDSQTMSISTQEGLLIK